ncbi:thioesterase II family protein [Bacillus solimangrovi]|uniref:Thioesterase domain-containing protein n=1 Tax=Bacillus solimangrovi TaxID=1305675 RepID=A0A1E5LK79_9BACI|nr:thioesterase domain-containing protein [Bacillus solimangrovi]OEH94428.1 hypothetical protein BFG57_08175 [Bacillus solimangrovi]
MQKTVMKNSPWLFVNKFSNSSSVRLFCLPYAGGGATIYHQWMSSISNKIEVCPIQLPGRENRIGEASYDNILFLVKEIAKEIEPYIDRPYALFGHSMGALICFELARELRRRKINNAERLFLSGRNAVHIPRLKPPIHKLDQETFINRLRELNGTPELLLQNKELMEFVIPIIRNDFKMVETYSYEQEKILNIPITVIGGTNDPYTSIEYLEEWREHTSNNCEVHQVEGEHFFLNNRTAEVLEIISNDLLKK